MTTGRCYKCDIRPASYVAALDYNFTPEFKLCVECAAAERAWGAVVEIHTLRTERDPGRSDFVRSQPTEPSRGRGHAVSVPERGR